MYRIRFHGRGGQGMKVASRILGTAFFLEGFNVQDAPRYGAERRGAPIFAYVRASRDLIHERGIIRHPDLVIVGDDSLVPVPVAGILSGYTAHTVLLLNTSEDAAVWKKRLNLIGPVIALPAEAEEYTELRFIGARCAGAAAGLLGAIHRKTLEKAIRLELEGMTSDTVQKNLEKALATHALMKPYGDCVKEGVDVKADAYESPEWIDLPFEQARISAPAIYEGLTSVQVKTGLWRSMRPVIDYARCNRCWWICSSFCPDGAISLDPEQYPKVDYDHCKGCMICVAQCPPHAIEAEPEHASDAGETAGDRT